MHSLINDKGKLTKPAILTLSAVSGVEIKLLEKSVIKSQRYNRFNLPWYSKLGRGGGGITLGDKIYLTTNYFDTSKKYGKFSFGVKTSYSMAQWLLILAHEVGHLPQSESFGINFRGQCRYLYYFAKGYFTRWIRPKARSNNFAPEIVADIGRYVFKMVFLDIVKKSPNYRGEKLFSAILRGSLYDVHEILDSCYNELAIARNEYMSINWESFYKVARKMNHEIFLQQNGKAA